jgi:hypothetical protein
MNFSSPVTLSTGDDKCYLTHLQTWVQALAGMSKMDSSGVDSIYQ